MLWLIQRLFYGPVSSLATSKPASDLSFGELAALTPLVILMLVMGVAPSLWFNTIQTGPHPPRETRQTVSYQGTTSVVPKSRPKNDWALAPVTTFRRSPSLVVLLAAQSASKSNSKEAQR
jgi:hypothetical protein